MYGILVKYMAFCVLINCVFSVFSCEWVCLEKDKVQNLRRGVHLTYSNSIITVPKEIEPRRNGPRKQNKRQYNKKKDPEVSLRMPDVYLGDPVEVSLKMPEFQVDPVEVSCRSEEFTRNMQALRKKIRCIPQPVLVDIQSTEGTVLPKKVSTKLCGGLCSGEKSCLSVKSTNISLPVRTILKNGQIKCTTVEVPADTKCKCGCAEPREKCLPTQTYEKKLCKCKCKNQNDFINCLNKASSNYNQFKWDANTCSCVCAEEKLCTTGTFWDSEICRCIRKNRNKLF